MPTFSLPNAYPKMGKKGVKPGQTESFEERTRTGAYLFATKRLPDAYLFATQAPTRGIWLTRSSIAVLAENFDWEKPLEE